MVIPKSFEDIDDLEAMLLTSILGTLDALKEDLISYQQAENYWLSDFMAEMFEQMKLSSEIVNLLQESTKLKSLPIYSEAYYEKIQELIQRSKNIIAQYYTEYDSQQEQQEFGKKLYSQERKNRNETRNTEV